MNIKMKLVLPLLLLLISQVYSIKVQCQNDQRHWKPNQRFKISEREILVSTIYEGVDLFVDNKDGYVSKIIINSGYWQPRGLRNMARFVEPGYSVLNVGSHIGIQAVVIGKGLGKNGKLFLFQPFSVSHNLAVKNVYFNGVGDITTVFNVGAGQTYSKGIEVIDLKNTGGSRVYPNSSMANDSKPIEEVIIDKVDDVLPLDTILNFVLIDAQRMELQVLNGMKKTILRSKNIIILCQWAGDYLNQIGKTQKMTEVVNWLMQHKFKFYQMVHGQDACTYARWSERSAQQIMKVTDFPDILFVPSHIDPNKVGL